MKKFRFLIIGIAVIASALYAGVNIFNAYAMPLSSARNHIASAPRTGLVGWWTMDANDTVATTTYDRSGFGRNGTTTGFYTGRPATSTQGKIGQAISFDKTGVNGQISITGSVGSVYTVSAWIKPSADGVNDTIVSLTGGSPPRIRWNTNNQAIFTGDGDSYKYTNSIPNAVGVWHHLVATVAGNTNMAQVILYVDGVASNVNGVDTGTFTAPGTSWLIGYGGAGFGNVFPGSIDDVRIYNRALSAAEVANLYNSAKTNYTAAPPRTGLVGWWTLDANDYNSSTKIFYDKSGFGKNATSVNAASFVAGKTNQAVSFNGTSDRIDTTYSLANLSSYTLSTWIKRNAPGAKMYLGQLGGTGQIQIGFYSDGLVYILPVSGTNYATFSSNDTNWHLATMVFDGSGSGNAGKLKMYMDGKSVALSYTGTIENVTVAMAGSFLQIGNNAEAGGYSKGLWDDVRVYNRALSAEDVSLLFRSSARNYIK